MTEKVSLIISRQARFDHSFGEQNLPAEGGNSSSQLVIVGQEINHGFESTDAGQFGPAKGQSGTESEMQATLQLFGYKDAGAKIHNAECFQFRAECGSGNAPVQARHHAHVRVLERSNHAAKVIRIHQDVAIVHDQMLILRGPHHLLKIADLHVGAQDFATHD